MKKVLIVANTDRHILLCHLPYLKYFKDHNYKVYVATNSSNPIEYCDEKICIPITRSPYHLSNIKAIRMLKSIILKEQFDLICCHTPMGGVITRLAAKKYRKKMNKPVIYTAHGFHFFKGAPLINWIVYYPIEKYLSKFTDEIITMNNEDYSFALKHFKTKISYINGIGFNKSRLVKSSKAQLDRIKKGYNIKKNDLVLVYIAELSKRKRQVELIKNLSKIDMSGIKCFLIGDNSYGFDINDVIESNNLRDNVFYVPYTTNISPYLNIANVCISYSIQEGMPLNILEAMSQNKFIVATNIRGHRDLITNKNNGMLFNSESDFIDILLMIKKNPNIISKANNDVSKYESANVLLEMEKIYNRYGL